MSNTMYLLSLSGLPGVVPFVLVMSLRSVPFVYVRTLWGSFVLVRRPHGVLFVLIPTVYSLSLRRLHSVPFVFVRTLRDVLFALTHDLCGVS